MDEYINREAVYEDFEKCNSENPKWTPSRVKTLITRQKAVDAVEVVRCRDCFYYTPEEDYFGKCVFLIGGNQYVVPDGYCYLGERKEGAD